MHAATDLNRPAALGGAVLVGGRSTRMGRDKARLTVNGVPLWRHQVRVLRGAGARPVVLVLRRRQRSLGNRGGEIRDTRADAGPLAGLHAALLASNSAWLAVLAVDMPLVDARWFRRLRRRCRSGAGAVIATRDRFEPLAAIYPHAALARVALRLEAGHFALQDLVRALVREKLMTAVRLPRAERRRLANWNTPGEVRAAPVPSRRRQH